MSSDSGRITPAANNTAQHNNAQSAARSGAVPQPERASSGAAESVQVREISIAQKRRLEGEVAALRTASELAVVINIGEERLAEADDLLEQEALQSRRLARALAAEDNEAVEGARSALSAVRAARAELARRLEREGRQDRFTGDSSRASELFGDSAAGVVPARLDYPAAADDPRFSEIAQENAASIAAQRDYYSAARSAIVAGLRDLRSSVEAADPDYPTTFAEADELAVKVSTEIVRQGAKAVEVSKLDPASVLALLRN